MKAKLEFDLEDTHDILAHRRAVSATDAFLALYAVQELIRNAVRHETLSGEKLSRGGVKYLDLLRQEFSDILERYDVNLQNLE